MRFLLLFFLLLALPSAVGASETVLYVELTSGKNAYLTIEKISPENFAEIKKLISNPMVQSAIIQRLAVLYCGNIRDFSITASAERVYVDVQCAFASNEGSYWMVEKKDLTGEATPFYLEIKLPKGYELVHTDPNPDVISGNILRWKKTTIIPMLVYKKSHPYLRIFLANWGATILVALIYARKKALR
jgi:hypothetical protein